MQFREFLQNGTIVAYATQRGLAVGDPVSGACGTLAWNCYAAGSAYNGDRGEYDRVQQIAERMILSRFSK
jgi:hypothetical protein